ncbi:MAG TPA: hypothetical protein PLG14_00890 [Spirochaetales bacterium]|nr:hypothetical protein [Spirochaetales bacterium]
MPSALATFLLLLAPVAAMLFLNLRLSRRLSYPHELLEEERRRGPAAFLFRALRAYWDLVLDAALALAVALALAGGGAPRDGAEPRGRPALVVDCSRSMLAGRPGSRPLDLAMRRLAEDESLRKAEPFALAFDPRTARTRLVPLRRLLSGVEGGGAAARLEGELAFLAVDYGELAALRRRGFGRITLLTDALPFRTEGFEAVELGFPDPASGESEFAAYPSSARHDRASGSWLVALVEAGRRGDLSVKAWRAPSGPFERLAPSRYGVEEGPAGRILRFSSPGLYLVSLPGPYGEAGADFALELASPATAASAEGPFSSRVLAAFPYLAASEKPELALVDEGGKGAGAAARAGGPRLVSTRLAPEDGRLVLSPALAGGRLIAAGAEPEAPGFAPAPASGGRARARRFVLGPAALANEDLPLAYDGAILAGAEPPFLDSTRPGEGRIEAAMGAYLLRSGDSLRPLAPPPSEYFAPARDGVLRLPPPPPPRLLWSAVLGLLSAAKLLAWRKSTGKRLLARG